MAKRLREGVMCGLLQMAIDKVKRGKDPGEDAFRNEEEKAYYETQVKDLEEYLAAVGPEQFNRTEFDIGYNYDDDDDEDFDDE